ncbi:NAD(P)/FAD-dependent oxidoreductase [Pseudalkalibacillus sp. A8]|uniref:NAD(P)/FAD-dependent oxidoreductase n=1 Tax=Pseudalkalibacillus sp. A8 TaxID=3382641 RepID=UPI0038B4D8E7
MSKKLLLIGVGKAHLSLLRKLKTNPLSDCEVTLLNPAYTYHYSDMFSGFVEGIYQLEDLQIDLADLTEKAGIRLIQGAALSIDVKQKMVLTEKGDILSFDCLSLDIDTREKEIEILPEQENIVRYDRKHQIERFQNHESKNGTVVIVGRGAPSIEISFAFQAWKQTHGDDEEVILISSKNSCEGNGNQESQRLKAMLRNAGVQVQENEKVVEVGERSIITDKRTISYDCLFWMTGPEAPKIYTSSKLPTDDQGYLLVEDTLQVKEFPFIFGAGNGVTIRNHPNLPRNGTMAEKQGEVLADNLKGYLGSGEGYHFEPQKRPLSIVSVGHQKALLKFGSFSTTGKLAWKLKNKIDCRFVASFR